MKNVARVALITCVVATFGSFVWGISFYYRDFPSKPHPEVGRTYPLNDHGFPLYLTKREDFEKTVALTFFFVFAVSAVIIDRFVDPFDRRRKEALPNKPGS